MQKMKSERKHLKSTEMANQRRMCDFWRFRSRRIALLNDVGRSKIANNVAQPNAEGFCDSEQRVNRDRPLRPFHLADVNGMKVRFLSQFLLAESGLLTVQSNILANQTAMFWRPNHSPLPKQQAARRSHKLPALDCACVANGESIKRSSLGEMACDPGGGKNPDCTAGRFSSQEIDKQTIAPHRN
jgi:hypothetical protein